MKHVEGKNKCNVMLYALSTCIWCKKTKKLLQNLGVEYYYEDVDLLEGEEREKAEKEISKWIKTFSFPLIVLNNNRHISGFDEQKIRQELGNE